MNTAIKEALEDLKFENDDEIAKAQYVFETLMKVNDLAESLLDSFDKLQQRKLEKYMKSMGLKGDLEDIRQTVAGIMGDLEELVEDDLAVVLPGLEMQIEEAKAKR